jgi:predicted CXXCH cytochrome family protein
MRRLAPALVSLSIAACSPGQPRVHQGAVQPPAGQALTAGDAHSVVREETASAYCLGCHPGLDLNSHPLGVSLLAAATANPDQYVSPPTNPLVVVVNGEFVECTSCHDDGTAGFPFRTVAADLCTPCHDKGGAPPPPPPPGDVTAPTVGLTVPGGGPVRGVVPILASVSDDVGVVHTEVWVGVTPETADQLVPTTGPTEAGAVTATLDTTTLLDGTWWIVVRAFDQAGNVGSAIGSLTIDNTAPSVAITSPQDGAILRWATTVSADAFDPRGLASVSLYADQALLATFAAPPYTVTWVPARRSGDQTLRAVATDLAGNQATASIRVNVK